MTPAAVDYGDVQGLVRYGYAHMTEARFLLLRIKDPRAPRAWLRAAPVTSGDPDGALASDGAPGRAHAGWARGAGRAARRPAGFFARVPRRPGRRGEPLAPAGRRRRRAARPAGSGRPGEGPPPDGPALRRAGAARALDVGRSRATLGRGIRGAPAARRRRSSTAWSRSGSSTASASRCWTGSSAGPSTEDATSGVQQRRGARRGPAGVPERVRQVHGPAARRPERRARRDLPAGRRRTRDARPRPQRELPRRPPASPGRPRILAVPAPARRTATPSEARAWPRPMVGRALTGDPLHRRRRRAPFPEWIPRMPDDVRYNQSHVRRRRPRHAVPARRPHPARPTRATPISRAVPPAFARTPDPHARLRPERLREDAIASTRFHRILRRGREYGPWSSAESSRRAASGDDESGLYFICLNANIARQFEFVQSAWIDGHEVRRAVRGELIRWSGAEPAPACPVTSTFSLPQASGHQAPRDRPPAVRHRQGRAYSSCQACGALRYLTSFGTDHPRPARRPRHRSASRCGVAFMDCRSRRAPRSRSAGAPGSGSRAGGARARSATG